MCNLWHNLQIVEGGQYLLIFELYFLCEASAKNNNNIEIQVSTFIYISYMLQQKSDKLFIYILFSLIFVLQITMIWKIGNNGHTYPILIDWLMFCSLTFPWQIFNTYSGKERNSLIYKYFIEIRTLRIFTWQFSIERVSISATVENTR